MSKSEPTMNVWWPRTIHPDTAVINKAINIESLPDIIHWLNLDIISLVKPEAGEIEIYTSGCLRNQGECWGDNKSPPLNGSREGQLGCRSEMIIVITPANTGRLIINDTGVKDIGRQYEGKNRKELIIERLEDFNKVTIELIDPNKLLNPTMCKEKTWDQQKNNL